jgi:hypothetical protein
VNKLTFISCMDNVLIRMLNRKVSYGKGMYRMVKLTIMRCISVLWAGKSDQTCIDAICEGRR